MESERMHSIRKNIYVVQRTGGGKLMKNALHVFLNHAVYVASHCIIFIVALITYSMLGTILYNVIPCLINFPY